MGHSRPIHFRATLLPALSRRTTPERLHLAGSPSNVHSHCVASCEIRPSPSLAAAASVTLLPRVGDLPFARDRLPRLGISIPGSYTTPLAFGQSRLLRATDL